MPLLSFLGPFFPSIQPTLESLDLYAQEGEAGRPGDNKASGLPVVHTASQHLFRPLQAQKDLLGGLGPQKGPKGVPLLFYAVDIPGTQDPSAQVKQTHRQQQDADSGQNLARSPILHRTAPFGADGREPQRGRPPRLPSWSRSCRPGRSHAFSGYALNSPADCGAPQRSPPLPLPPRAPCGRWK